MGIVLKNVVIFVTDIDRAKRFYVDMLGLPVSQQTQAVLEFFNEGTKLGIAVALHEEARKLVGRHTGVTLQVQGIDDLCGRLAESGVRFPEPLERSPWGKMAVVADPDGNQIALVEG
jgi:predicted enzyme related to lactoylglutathione lyase